MQSSELLLELDESHTRLNFTYLQSLITLSQLEELELELEESELQSDVDDDVEDDVEEEEQDDELSQLSTITKFFFPIFIYKTFSI